MSVNLCHKCNKEVSVNNGGCVLMIAFCHNYSTNLINLAFCSDCYDKFVNKEMRALNDTADLRLYFGAEGSDDGKQT